MADDLPNRRDFLWQAAGAGVASALLTGTARAQTPGASGSADAGQDVKPLRCALYPQQNRWRSLLELSGLWDFQTDPDGAGEQAGWFNGLPAPHLIAVPGSWNEQFMDLRDYFGAAWYVTRTTLPAAWRGQRIVLRVGSAVYGARVWIDGRPVGAHLGGNLPFAFEVTGAVGWDRPVTIAIRVENELLPDRVPPTGASDARRAVNKPDVTFDFFPYCGLHRAVTLHTLPPHHLDDVTVTTSFDGSTGLVRVQASANDGYAGPGRVQIGGGAAAVAAALSFQAGRAEATLRLPNVRAWSPQDPHLYALAVGLGPDEAPVDGYALDVGVRTITVDGDKLLLNGQPVVIRGTARHEDFPVNGRGWNAPVAVRDIQMIKWLGGNSFRTSHYPYNEETMRLADREGMLVIDEIPAVDLYFSDSDAAIQTRLAQCKQDIEELVARDKNHPCVIIWSLANEPQDNRHAASVGIAVPANDDYKAKGRAFFEQLFAHARAQDSTRPISLVAMAASDPSWWALGDVNLLNRYWGWYEMPGQAEAAAVELAKDLDAVHADQKKPVIITEFGADALAGCHAEPPEMWTEEYQALIVDLMVDVVKQRPWIVGLHIWCLNDFKTAQAVRRAGGVNMKGVFTRDRRPKMAAHRLRAAWSGLKLGSA